MRRYQQHSSFRHADTAIWNESATKNTTVPILCSLLSDWNGTSVEGTLCDSLNKSHSALLNTFIILYFHLTYFLSSFSLGAKRNNLNGYIMWYNFKRENRILSVIMNADTEIFFTIPSPFLERFLSFFKMECLKWKPEWKWKLENISRLAMSDLTSKNLIF